MHGRDGNGNELYSGFQFNVDCRQVKKDWGKSLLRGLVPFFVTYLDTAQRLNGGSPQARVDVLKQHPQHPVQLVSTDDRVEDRVNTHFKSAFGLDLMPYHGGGSHCALLVGKRPVLGATERKDSKAYSEKLVASTSELSTQGDGMRSFATILLGALATETQSIVLVDEPEAFLHPPQCRLIGRMLAEERQDDAQVVAATHSKDVLEGLLSVGEEQLKIIRLDRSDDRSSVTQLDADAVRRLVGDPVMRNSELLSGLFHKRVVLCESDGDCHFYGSILQAPVVRGQEHPDVFFTHANGKDRLALLAAPLVVLGVPVDIIVDIDVIRTPEVLKALVEAVDADWSSFEDRVKDVGAAVEEQKNWLNSTEVAGEIGALLKKAPSEGPFPAPLKKDIFGVFRRASPWELVKRGGVDVLPRGQATEKCRSLIADLAKVGIWIVPKGEMESFCKSVGGKGARWVQEVLETRDIATDDELAEARKFIKELWNSR